MGLGRTRMAKSCFDTNNPRLRSTSGSSGWWRRRTSCPSCATARSPSSSSPAATSCTSTPAQTWTRWWWPQWWKKKTMMNIKGIAEEGSSSKRNLPLDPIEGKAMNDYWEGQGMDVQFWRNLFIHDFSSQIFTTKFLCKSLIWDLLKVLNYSTCVRSLIEKGELYDVVA